VIEREFEEARARVGLPVDLRILAEPPPERLGSVETAGPVAPDPGMTLRQLYDAYMTDPTTDWSPRTRLAYETTRKLVLGILGADTPIRSITRAQCREMIETLRWQPRHARKLYPGLGPVEIAAKAREQGRADLMSASNLNTYLNKLGGVFNFAMREELMDRNPARGLRVPDPTLRRDKRLPFSTAQLQAIFTAPLFTGCRDDGHGYAFPGDKRPRNARFWLPLIALYCGLRQNEACQLDVSDVRLVDDVHCFVVSASSQVDTTDKRLKTASSARTVPVHPDLVALNFIPFVAQRRHAGEAKLFPEVGMGATGYRSTTFSAWFTRFTRKAGASSSKTCFHSFRHNFRDALREARVERDISLALGGWSAPGGSGGLASVSDAYGSGFKTATLFEAISRVRYPDLDLSHLHQGT
jgi:integrase